MKSECAMLFEEQCPLLEQRRMVLAAFSTAHDGHIAPSKQRRRLRCAPWFPPGRPAELPSVLPHDRGRRLQPNADTAALIDKSALDRYPPTDIFSSQYPRDFPATLTRMFASNAICGVKLL
jgi:hypothetical protein